MNTSLINIYKPVGATPLEMIRKLQAQFPKYEKVPLGYAGRLDPMAEGVLLVLVGEENKKRKEYERLEKTYEFEILFGIETDTYDLLGLIQACHESPIEKIKHRLKRIINKLPSTFEQPYPPYSSARVGGKPLFYWAREGKIDEVSIPKKTVSIYHASLEDVHEHLLSSLYPSIREKISTVSGEFRQQEIMAKWQKVHNHSPDIRLTVIRCRVSCSSGLYIRSLAHSIGQQLSTGAIALSIKRTAVGEYRLQDAIILT